MPVGIVQTAAPVVQIGADAAGHMRSGMRQAQHDGAVAARDLDGHHAPGPSMGIPATSAIAPEAIICAARSRSGAM